MKGLFSYNFDVDRYIIRIVPRSRLYLLPKPVSWFLGHRETPRKPIGNVVTWFWAFIGAFIGILVVEAVFMTETLKTEGAPVIVASLVCLHVHIHVPSNFADIASGCRGNSRI